MQTSGNRVSPSDTSKENKVKDTDSCSIEMSNGSTSSVISKNEGIQSYFDENSIQLNISKKPKGSDSYSRDIPNDSSSSIEDQSGVHSLLFRVTEVPPLKQLIFLAFQQAMICISGLLAVPYLVSGIACAGNYTTTLRIKLISSTFFITGFTTFLQTSIGLRLPILQGPSLAFFPPLYAFANLPDMKCNYSIDDEVPEQHYLSRIQTIEGSLVCSSLLLILIGSTGAIGIVSKLIGPVTIFPLMMLLCLGNVDVIVQKASAHWISVM